MVGAASLGTVNRGRTRIGHQYRRSTRPDEPDVTDTRPGPGAATSVATPGPGSSYSPARTGSLRTGPDPGPQCDSSREGYRDGSGTSHLIFGLIPT